MVVIYCMYVLVHGGGVVWPDRPGVWSDRSGLTGRLAFGSGIVNWIFFAGTTMKNRYTYLPLPSSVLGGEGFVEVLHAGIALHR